MDGLAARLLESAKNFVFLGETGSGKTEVALNLALALTAETDARVHFFDLDQTKPLLRARDAAGVLERAGVVFHCQAQYLDAPTVVSGVEAALLDSRSVVLLDVGGGHHGAHMIGQFSHILNRGDTAAFYLVNPYRAWSGSAEEIAVTRGRIAAASGISRAALVGNPNLGPDTTLADIREGLRRLDLLRGEAPVRFLCALERLCPLLRDETAEPVLPLRLMTRPDWLE